MSFQETVTEELIRVIGSEKNTQKAELSAILSCLEIGQEKESEFAAITLQTERPGALTKCFTLLQKTANIICMSDYGEDLAVQLNLPLTFLNDLSELQNSKNSRLSVQNDKNAQAFVRGTFLGCGIIAEPEKEYQLEFMCRNEKTAQLLKKILSRRGIEMHTTQRKSYQSLYTRDADTIADLLTLMGAHGSLLELENARIMKQVRSNVNRQVNCETANIRKTVSAARKQMEDINILKEKGALTLLPENLQEMARLRTEYPEASLQELGELMDPPVGKSGVNHRLRRLSEAAEKLRKGEQYYD